MYFVGMKSVYVFLCPLPGSIVLSIMVIRIIYRYIFPISKLCNEAHGKCVVCVSDYMYVKRIRLLLFKISTLIGI